MFQRAELLVGPAAMERLGQVRVILFGLGGVGSWCAEALVRSGVAHLTLVDGDRVELSNVNRQLQAMPGNVGRPKADELADRLRAINPDAEIVCRQEAYGEENKDAFELESYDYVLDAIDALGAKASLIARALAAGRTLFASMGAARRLDPTQVRVGSIWESSGCPLARRVRRRLRGLGVTADFKVVYSREQAQPGGGAPEDPGSVRAPIGSLMPVVATFGLVLASLVIRDVHGA
jgi:tRNA A37 threonylcarbamoyladenosine dehydratase